MKYLFSFFILLFSVQLYSQSDSIEYLDASERIINNKNEATYYRKISLLASDTANKLLEVTQYWMDRRLYMHGICLNNQNLSKKGTFTFYYKNGSKESEGTYFSVPEKGVNSIRNGKWGTWYPSGQPMCEWFYKISDTYKSSEKNLINFWDSTGVQLVKGGEGEYYYSDSVSMNNLKHNITFSGIVKEGKFDSIWTGYFPDNKVYSTETYNKGKFVSGKSYDRSGNEFTYDSIEANPTFPGGDAKLIRFLENNTAYPWEERSNNIQGSVLVRFVVSEDGSVTDIKIIQGGSEGFNREALRIVKKLPKFSPGKLRGQLCSVYYYLPIVFKLQ